MSISLTRSLAVAIAVAVALPLSGCGAAEDATTTATATDANTATAADTAEKRALCTEVGKALEGVTKALSKEAGDVKAMESAVDDMRAKFGELAEQASDTEVAKALKDFARDVKVDNQDEMLKFSQEMNKLSVKVCG